MESGFRSSNSVISSSFARLKKHPAVWIDYKEYFELGLCVMDLSVTNDAAKSEEHPRSGLFQQIRKHKRPPVY